MAGEKQQQADCQLQKSSKLDAIITECFITPSQEEVLNHIPGWTALQSQSENATDYIPSSQETCSRLSTQDNYNVGADLAIIYTPKEETQFPEEPLQEHQAEDEQPQIDTQDLGVTDSFELKFESDRELSPNTQSQNFVCITKSFMHLINPHLHTPTSSPTKVSSSVTSKKPANKNNKIIPRPASCRRILDKDDAQPETPNPANSLPYFVAETSAPTDKPHPVTQLEASAPHVDNQFSPSVSQLPSNFDHIDSQFFQSYPQIDTQLPPAGKLVEEQQRESQTNEGDEFRGRRILLPSLSAPTVQRDTPTALETEAPVALKRQRKEAKPVPENLMDVIMHYSGEPPVGFENVDIVETAIKAGMTFPLPLSRHWSHT